MADTNWNVEIIKKAVAKLRANLQRQEDAVKTTKAMIELNEAIIANGGKAPAPK